MEKNRAAFNLRRRNARKKEAGLGCREKEVVVEATVARTEMPFPENPPPFTTKKVGEFRMIVLPEEKPAPEAPVGVEIRSAKDVIGGIYRNDHGGVISKFAWEKLQRAKQDAKDGGYELDDYSQGVK